MSDDLRFLGLLNRGGGLRFGPDCLHARKGALLLLATDASSNTKKQFLSFADNLGIEVVSNHSKSELGQALGYEGLSAVLIVDARAAKAYKAKALL